MLKDKDIICISPINWDFLKQRHQILMQMFAAQGNRITYIENINPFFVLNLSLLPRLYKRITRIFFKASSQNMLPYNINVISPLVIPLKNKLATLINEKILLKIIASKIRRNCTGQPIIWTYLSTSSTLQLIKYLSPSLLIYDCVFDAPLHPNSPKDIESSEKKLMKTADCIFTDNQHLFEKCKSNNKNTCLIRPGVDFQNFNNAQPPKKACPIDKIHHPRLCFFGGIDKIRIDLDLIAYIAKEKPDWNVIFCGPVINTRVSSIKFKNVFFLGTFPYTELASYLQSIDIFILPYKIKPFTKSIFPAKIFECMAMGKPIVSTPLEELLVFQDIIKIADTFPKFIACITEALSLDNTETINRGINMSKENSWKQRFEKINAILSDENLTNL
jgi:glycosyltransferase involved in cell wall biosynthesis